MLAIRHPARRRRGAILLVVLAMLALFAVIALSFVLYAESEATSMRNGRAARNEIADPNPQEAANSFLGQLLIGTDDNTSAMYGHDLATNKYGWVAGGGQSYSPYSGVGLENEDVSTLVGLPAGTLNRRQTVNYTKNSLPPGPGLPQYVYPHLRIDGFTKINKSTPYTYADRANFYLAMQDPVTGRIIQPSFLRPDLFGPLDITNGGAISNNWTNDVGRYLTTRPRPKEHPAFPLVPADADGIYRGDVANMKFINGSQQNDSLWMYAGAPVKEWRGKQYVSMIAPLILDLSGRINMSVAGNNRGATASASNQGFGGWEVNPSVPGMVSAADLQAILTARYNAANAPANRYTGSTNGNINGGKVPPQISRIDADGVGPGPAMSAPTAGTYNPFMVFSPSFAPDAATYAMEMANHPSTYNPFHWPRGPQTPTAAHAGGMDDLIKLNSRYSDPKNRYLGTELGSVAGTSFVTGPNAAQTRALTTNFNVTQSWAEVQIATNGGFAKLGPVDLNRPLRDYRSNTNPFSTANVTVAGVAPAISDRQRLAMDIFLRLAALVPGVINGTDAFYNPAFHSLNPVAPGYASYATLQKLAQYAANIVDAIDNDDVMTMFIWNPINSTLDPTDAVNLPLNTTAAELGNRVVFGTELPRLVVNEAYCKLDNDRSESKDAGNKPPLVAGKRPATKPIQKKYWIELHNALPVEVAGSVLSDLGAARLQTGPGANTNFYQVVIADYDPAKPLSAPSNVTGDPTIAGLTIQLTINDFTRDPSVPAAEQILVGDEQYHVHQATGAPLPATNGGNEGYFVLGPLDKFPPPAPPQTLIHSSSLPDPGASPTVNTLIAGAGAATSANIDIKKAEKSLVILRRLANPYLPEQKNPLMANFNPFITVDTLDNVPTRDRVEFDSVDARTGAGIPSTEPSIGRKHPYANTPIFDVAQPDLVTNSVVRQSRPAADMVSPGHSFFRANYSAAVANPGGFAPFIHFDRELINSTELMHVSILPPHLLMQRFSDGTLYNLHNRVTPTSITGLLDVQYPSAGLGTNLFRAFDLLTTANRMPGIPLGGREPGRVNINTIGSQGVDGTTLGDPRILQAVLDPQLGNTFAVNPTYAKTAWAAMMNNRTNAWPVFKATADEKGTVQPTTDDRPYKLGSGAATFDDTLFRSPTGAIGDTPMLFNPAEPINLYLRAEPHRKAWNNLTTVSDGFLVIWTVGFFELDPLVPYVVGLPPTLGKELFDKVPGDLRAQYSAVVDRSMLQVPAPLPAVQPAPGTNGPKPWETKLLADAPVGSGFITVEGSVYTSGGINYLRIFNDGVAVDIQAGSQIRLGTGDSLPVIPAPPFPAPLGDGEWVTIALDFISPTPPVPPTVLAINPAGAVGQVNVSLSTFTTRFHGGSSRVGNTLPGNPGPPQTPFDATNPANRHLVPYFTRLEP